MSGLKYAYTPRRSRRGRGRAWLTLPVALVAAAVLLGLRLSDDGGEPSARGAPCTTGTRCAAARSLSGASRPAAGSRASGEGPAAVDASSPPTIGPRAAAVVEEPCGALTYARNPHQRLAPASLTKMATALVAAERADLAEIVTVRVNGADLAVLTDSTVMGLRPGQKLSLHDLLYGLLLPSGNDAAIAIAEHVGGSVPAFVQLMNEKAEQLGLSDTHFANAHGLDEPGLYTSAFDSAMLGRELLRQPALAEAVRARTYRPAWDGPALRNLNQFLSLYPKALGVKTGYTDAAGQTIVAAAERDGRRLIVSVLGSTDIYQDAISLLDWAFSQAPSSCARAGQGRSSTGG